MNTIRNQFLLPLCATVLSGLLNSVMAATPVVSMDIKDFSFTLLPPATSPGYFPASAVNRTIGTDTNLVAGAVNPVFQFDVTLNFMGVRTENWSTVAYTTTASTATIDTTTNQFNLNLASFMTDWDGPRCPPSFPSCSGVAQSPVGNTVTGLWDPLTQKYSISWDAYIPGHPFPDATGRWTLTGVAMIPEPEQWTLMLVGLGMLGGLLVRRQTKSKIPGSN
jgi:hypothetical protein